MRKRILLTISVILMITFAGCGKEAKDNNIATPTGTINIEDNNEENISTPTPIITESVSEEIPVNIVEEMKITEKYWIYENEQSGFYFSDDVFNLYVDGYKFVYDYEVRNNRIIISNETALLVNDEGNILMDNGISLHEYKETTKEEFEKAFIENTTTVNHSSNKNAEDYIGMTINNFVKTGAEISGYIGVQNNYEFSAYNEEKLEKYSFTLKGNIREALEKKSSFDDYEDFLGTYTIETINVIKLDNSKLDKYVNKPLQTLLDDGLSIKGYVHFSELLLYAYDDENNLIEVFLDETASKIYQELEDPSYEILEDLCKDCIIKKLNYNIYW